MKKKKKSVTILKGERMLTFMILIALILFPIGTVLTKATLSETNISVEKLERKVSDQESVNESLSMQVDELASLDKIESVVSEKGLSYNNSNVKNIIE